jgi:hypothetical protein
MDTDGYSERCMMAIQGSHRGPAGLTSRGGAASAKSGRADSRRANEDDKSLARLKRALRKAERRAGDGSDIGPNGTMVREGVLTKEEAERDVSTRNTPTSMAFVTHPRM